MKTRTVLIDGYKVDVYYYKNGSYLYPQFNGDAEFKCTGKGFKQLRKYLRNISWMDNQVKEIYGFSFFTINSILN